MIKMMDDALKGDRYSRKVLLDWFKDNLDKQFESKIETIMYLDKMGYTTDEVLEKIYNKW